MNISEKDRQDFRAFYQTVDDKEDIIYMYFSTGLLHYAIESCSLVPNSRNMILITTCLSEEEKDVIKNEIKRPFFNFEQYYHDGDIWNLIAAETQGNFGWLDVDCFIFNPSLFDEMARFKDNIGINTLWVKTYDCYCLEDEFSNTYFQYFKYDVLKMLREKYGHINMLPIVFEVGEDEIPYERYYCLPQEEKDRLFCMYPQLKKDKKGLDTTHYYQLLMFAEGYRINRVRELSQMKRYYSDEALHLGGCHMIHRIKLDTTLKRIYYRFNMRYSFCLLCKYLHILPEQYKRLYGLFEANLNDNKINCSLEDMKEQILGYAKRNGLESAVRNQLMIGE